MEEASRGEFPYKECDVIVCPYMVGASPPGKYPYVSIDEMSIFSSELVEINAIAAPQGHFKGNSGECESIGSGFEQSDEKHCQS